MAHLCVLLLCFLFGLEHTWGRESTCRYTINSAGLVQTTCLRHHACASPSATNFRFFTTELTLHPIAPVNPVTLSLPLGLHSLCLSNRYQPITKGHYWHIVPHAILTLLNRLTLFDVEFSFTHAAPVAHLQLRPSSRSNDPNGVDGTFLHTEFDEATSVIFRMQGAGLWNHLAQLKFAWLDRFNGTVTSINTTWLRGVRFPFRRLHQLIPLDHLESLALFNCTLPSIHPDHLVIMPRLRQLEIVSCGVHAIHPDAFNPHFFPRLRTLNMSRNNLVHIPGTLGQLPYLTVLDLSGNSRTRLQLPGKALVRWGQLKALSLRASNVSLDSLAQLQWLGQLHYLDLAECALQVLPDHFFASGFHQLRHLDLSLNGLQALDDASLSGLRQLRTLDVSKNALALPPRAKVLTLLPRLQQASLAHNALVTVPLLSSGARNVSMLLSNNRIRSWNETLFPSDVHLDFLNLSHNDINEVTLSMLLDMGRATRLAFHANPFDCSSQNFPNLHFVLQLLTVSPDPVPLPFTPNHSSPTLVPDYLCAHPAELRTKPVLSVHWPSTDPSSEHALYHDTAAAIIFGLMGFLWAFYRVNRPTPLRRWRARGFLPHGFQFDAFICYSSSDRNWVANSLIPQLERTNPEYRLCLHERNFALGVNYVDNIWRCLSLSRRHIFLVSEAFMENPWCQYETEAAEYLRVAGGWSSPLVFLVSYEPVVSTLSYLMDQNTVMDWPSVGSKEEEVLWGQLRRALGPPLPPTHRLYPNLIEVGPPVISTEEPMIPLVLFECL